MPRKKKLQTVQEGETPEKNRESPTTPRKVVETDDPDLVIRSVPLRADGKIMGYFPVVADSRSNAVIAPAMTSIHGQILTQLAPDIEDLFPTEEGSLEAWKQGQVIPSHFVPLGGMIARLTKRHPGAANVE